METPSVDLRTRLQNAIEDDDSEAAIDCLRRGLDPDVRLPLYGERTMPAVSLCIRKGRITIMEALVRSGCNVNQPYRHGITPLYDACAVYGSWPVASYLLSKGALVDAHDADGNTPLLAAAFLGKLSLEMLRGLLEAGTDVNCRNHRGMNVLHIFLMNKYLRNHEDNAHLIEHVLTPPYLCDVNATTSQGSTPLHIAVLCTSFQCARLLIRAGCALECEDVKKLTPMGYALKYRHFRFIELLVAAGVVIPRPEWIKLRKSLKDDPERLKSLLEVGADFPKLSNMCRRAFYDHFGREARTRVENLPLCPLIKSYLLFEIL